MTEQHALVTGGVDTHKDTLAVAALNAIGGLLGQDEFRPHPLAPKLADLAVAVRPSLPGGR